MLPGVVLEEPFTIKSFGNLKKGDLVSINLTDNMAPVAVGTAALSSFDMYMSAKRGKGVHIVHYNGDLLCSNIKLGPPNLGPPKLVSLEDLNCENKLIVDESSDYLEKGDLFVDSNTISQSDMPKIDELYVEGNILEKVAEIIDHAEECDEPIPVNERVVAAADCGVEKELVDTEKIVDCDCTQGVDSSDAEIIRNDLEISSEPIIATPFETEGTGLSSQELMDKLMEYCFLKALKTTARKLSLPLLTSNFFKLHMIPACPKSDTLDVKRSSYKKLSKFLKEMEGKKVIEVRELTKGVESIVSVNYDNPLLKQFVEDSDDEEGSFEHPVSKAPEVNEMFVINATTLPLFRVFGYKKGESLMATSIRQHLTDYVTKKSLQSSDDKRFVKLDHLLSSCLRLKENDQITWKELMTTCIEQMGNSYSIGQSGSVSKGKLKPIEITVATRTGNKKVTLIGNLEAYGIDCTEFAKKCQHGVAASATITQVPGSKSSQVMVQGNQVIFLEKLLTGEYQIHKRYIRGLENAPKMKKSKRPISK
ncbi:eukaryotic translation initiation factor 2D isoform X2 [Ischnura elegans]|nr:eukaryotic translation initiation factor 2D isoform X2 [Ischnura elegans]